MSKTPLATLPVTGPRRYAALGALICLAAVLFALAGRAGMPPGVRFAFPLIGAAVLWGAWEMYKAGARNLILTGDGIFDTSGRQIAALENIVAVDRGIFAVKPSGGFAVRLKKSVGFGWAPGVWWRIGRRLGVGGAVPGPEAKLMADILEIELARRDGRIPDEG